MGSQPLTSARRQHIAVEIRHQLLGDGPAASHRSKQYKVTLFMKAEESSKNHMRSGTQASSQSSDHARQKRNQASKRSRLQPRGAQRERAKGGPSAEGASAFYRGAEPAAHVRGRCAKPGF